MWSGLMSLLLACTSCGPAQPAGMRCTVRVSAKGVFVDGDATTPEAAVAACKKRNGATVIVEDGVDPNVWPPLRRELEDAHVKIYMRGVVNDRICNENPLAKGCE